MLGEHKASGSNKQLVSVYKQSDKQEQWVVHNWAARWGWDKFVEVVVVIDGEARNKNIGSLG